MDPEVITWIWLAAGLLLCAIELFVPGMVVVFLGLAAVAVGILRWIGLVEGLPASFIWWMVSSIVLVASLRRVVSKRFEVAQEGGDPDEGANAFGREVEVVDALNDTEPSGRIRFQGTTWPAVSVEGELAAGTRARIVYRDNLAWVVEPIPALEAPREGPVPASTKTAGGQGARDASNDHAPR